MNIKNIVVGPLETNCYIIEENDKCIVIDPGDEFTKIDECIEKELIAILVTHRHFDHIGALKPLINKYKIPVYDYSNLKEGINKIDNFTFEVIYTPGHTSDSVTYYFSKDNIMFTGDFIFFESIGRCDLPTGNFSKMQKSISKIVEYCDKIDIYPGHGIKTTLGYEKKTIFI